MSQLLRSLPAHRWLITLPLLWMAMLAGPGKGYGQQACPFFLDNLLPPVACAGGEYCVRFTAPCLGSGTFTAELSQPAPVGSTNYDFSTPLAQTTGFGTPVCLRIPLNADTSATVAYGIRVRHSSGVISNVKAITIRPIDRSPKPSSTIRIVPPARAVYCPRDTVVFELTTLSVPNNFPPATYQWLRNGVAIIGADGPILRLTGLQPNDCIRLLVTKGNPCAQNDTGSSNQICLDVKRPPTAQIRIQGSGCADSTTLFTLDTTNIGPGGRVQWFLGTRPIPGATGFAFTLLPNVAVCGDQLRARVYTSDCPDSVTTSPVRIRGCGTVQVTSVLPPALCAGDSLTIAYQTTACFEPGNVFTFQLSDASGNFGSPRSIGAVSDTIGGTIVLTIPADLPSGTGYRIRILTSQPVGISLNTGGPIEIFARPQPPIATPASRCGPGPLTARVTSTGATAFEWFTSSVGQERVRRPGTGALVTTDTFTINLTRDTTFYVVAINGNGCRSTVRTPVTLRIGQPIRVEPGPPVTACQEGPCLTLVGASPVGGIYSGQGIVGGQFCPAGLAPGSYTIQYLVTTPEGCRDSATRVVTILPVPAPDAGTPDSTVCRPGPPFRFQLQGFSPAGGEWGGSPAVDRFGAVTVGLLSGVDTLRYTVTVGGCQRSDTRILRSSPSPDITVTVTPPTACGTPDGSVTVSPFDAATQTITFIRITDGTTVGTGSATVTGLAAGTYRVTVRSTGPQGCERSEDFVIADPSATRPVLSGLAPTYCSGDPCVPLTALPPGGTFSASVSGAVDPVTGVFCPTNAGTGVVDVFYAALDLSGCLGADTARTTIIQAPGIAPEPDTSVCANAGRFALSGGGDWSGSPGVVRPSPTGPYFFDPALALPVNILSKTVVAGACSTTVTRTISVLQLPALTLAPTGTARLCRGDSISVTATITPPAPGLSVFWLRNGQPFRSGPLTIRVGQGGVYQAVLISGPCLDTTAASVTIIQDTVPRPDAGADLQVCANARPLALSGVPPGGTWVGPGVISLPTGGFAFDPSLVTARTEAYVIAYRLTAGGCADSATRRVFVTPAPNATLNVQPGACGQPVTLAAGVAPGARYEFFLVGTGSLTPGGGPQPNFLATQPGNYFVVVSLPDGSCPDTSATVPVQISAPPTLPPLVNIVACTNDGAVFLPFALDADSTTWSGPGVVNVGPSTYVFNPATAGVGSRVLRVRARQGVCVSADSIIALVAPPPTISLTTRNASSCLVADGSARLTGVDTATTRIFWNIGQSTDSISGLSTGTYSVTLTNRQTGCSSTQTFFITDPGGFAAQILGFSRQYCADEDLIVLNGRPRQNGDFRVQVQGGGLIDIPGTVLRPLQLGPGRYTLFYSADSLGCTGSDSASFTIAPLPIATLLDTGTVTLCQGRTTTLRLAPDTGVRQIQWFGPTGLIAGATGPQLVVSQTGQYSAQVTRNGCTARTRQVTVNVLPGPGAGLTSSTGGNVICQGQALTLIVTSNAGRVVRYLGPSGPINDTNRTLSVRLPGSYQVIVTNGACTDTSVAFAVTVQPRPVAQILSNTLTPCVGDSAVLTAAPGTLPGVSYEWIDANTGSVVATGPRFALTGPADIRLRALAATGGCDSTTASVAIRPAPRPDTRIDTAGPRRFCQGGSVVLQAVEPQARYLWQGPGVAGDTNRSVTVRLPGTYTVQLTRGGCVATSQAVTVTVDSVPAARLSQTGNLQLCQGQPLTLSANTGAGLIYQWVVTNQDVPGATAPTFTVPTAFPGNLTVTVRVSTPAGCAATATPLQVQVRPRPTATLTALSPLSVCPGGAVTLFGNPAGAATPTFLVDGQRTINAPAPGNLLFATERGRYQYVLTQDGCSDTSAALAVIVPQIPRPNAGPDTVVCITSPPFSLRGYSPILSDSVFFTGPGIVGGDIFSAEQAGSGPKFIVLTRRDSGCAVTDTLTVTVVPGFFVTVDPPSTTVCAQTTTLLTPTLNPSIPGVNYTFQWQLNGGDLPGATDSTILATQEGTYRVLVTGGQCTSLSLPAQITFRPFEPVVTAPDTAVCAGGIAFTVPAAPAGGVWSGQSVTQNGIFDPQTPGEYTLLYSTDQNGCRLVDSITIRVNALPSATARFTNLITGNDNEAIDITDAVLLRATGGARYTWTPAAGLASPQSDTTTARPFSTTTYTVTVATEEGCQAQASVTVTVRTDVRVANGFSPNGDGLNETWNIYNIQAYPQATIKVYNRWGGLVYESVGYDRPFDGRSRTGEALPVGAYYYVIDLQNNLRPFTGSVSLLR